MVVEAFDSLRGQIQPHHAVGDLRHLLGGNVLRLRQNPRRDGKTIEDVRTRVADDLLDLSDLAAVGGYHGPAGLDYKPRDRVGHFYTGPLSPYQTGPCVATALVSDSAQRIARRALIPSSSSRAMHRLAISDDAP